METNNPLLQDLIAHPVVAKRVVYQNNGSTSVEVPSQVAATQPPVVNSGPTTPTPLVTTSVPPKPKSDAVEDIPVEEKSTAESLLAALRVGDEVPKSKPTPEGSLSDMRKRNNELSTQLSSKDEEITSLKDKLQRYETGEVVPQVLQEKDEEISKLSHYRDLHALKLSPEFSNKYIKPLQELNERAATLARECGIDISVLNEAYSMPNKRDMQTILLRHMDAVSALEARNVLDSIRDVSIKAAEAEKAPQEELTRLQSEAATTQEQFTKTTRDRISGVSKSAWTGAINELRAADVYPELTLKNDPEHDKIVHPIITRASAEYDKIVSTLVEHGLKELPPTIAKVLAKYVAIAQASAVIAESRNQHNRRAEEAISESKRMSSIVRPQIGGRTDLPALNGREYNPKKTLEDRSSAHLNSVLGKR